MTILINFHLHMGCITGILGNFYTKRGGEFLTSITGITSGTDSELLPENIAG